MSSWKEEVLEDGRVEVTFEDDFWNEHAEKLKSFAKANNCHVRWPWRPELSKYVHCILCPDGESFAKLDNCCLMYKLSAA